MTINPDIRDQAYQFFSAEAPDLLQVIETGLLSLSQNRHTAEVHNLMRAAHSLKGGAASVGLDAIATLSHRLENIFKALYSETLEIDTNLESQLLLAYDCLRLPLMEQITTGYLNAEEALAIADPILTQIEQYCGEALLQTESYIPSSSDMGVNMLSSILEVDIAQGLKQLEAVVAHPQDYEVAGELRAQVEVFAGFAEILNLPSLGEIAETIGQALTAHPDRALEITQLALVDFERVKQGALGDRSQPVEPSEALLALANGASVNPEASITATDSEALAAMPLLENIFGNAFENILTDDGFAPHSFAPDSFDHDSLSDTFDPDTFDPDTFDPDTFDPDTFDPDTISELDTENAAALAALAASLELADFNEPIEAIALPSKTLEISDVSPQPPEDLKFSETIDAEWVMNSPAESGDVRQAPVEPEINLAPTALPISRSAELYQPPQPTALSRIPARSRQTAPAVSPSLTVRVDSDRLERMNNLVGELMINRDGLSLQSEQLQGVLRELQNRFARFQTMVSQLQGQADQMLISPERRVPEAANGGHSPYEMRSGSKRSEGGMTPEASTSTYAASSSSLVEFDPLEMDSYGSLHSQFQELLEDMVQLEEAIDDINLFNRQSNRILEQQQQTLAHLQNEFRWARMLPLGEVLNRFPRVLRDLSTTYRKPANLKFTGTEILIDKAILEKLYDPLLHLLRNAFDHGIEPANVRLAQGKPEQGQLEIRAYYKGNQTIIEVKDDGQGLNLDRIRSRAFELGWLSPDQLIFTPPAQLFEFIFEPGFSTASQVSELSGRGVGLDVVRSQLHAIKGSVAVTSMPGQGTTFTLYLPLTLTIAKLIICLVGSTALSISADSVEEVLTPQPNQIKRSGTQRFLYWREQIIPTYRLADLLDYACPLPDAVPSKALATVASPQDWAPPMLILRQEQQVFALEVDRLVNEQELVIKPFGSAITPPSYAYGCTILGDGSLIPIIDGAALLALERDQSMGEPDWLTLKQSASSARNFIKAAKAVQTSTILVVDDAITLRQTLTLSLGRAGFRVLQARDGWEAIDQLRQSPAVKLVICDVEMPNMNGFEFLSYRRQDPELATIPVVMLTSRSNTKHRWLALQLGATDYFSKPYLEQEFLAAIKKIIQ